MPRSTAAVIQNNFVGGLKTDFTGLNFPENSATETYDCIFSKIGRVTRRKGFDIEDSGAYTTLNRTSSVVTSYVWKNVAGDGNTTLLVEQVGNALRFYEVSDPSTALSNQLLASSITLTSFLPSGSVQSPIASECQYASGNGYLFVFHKDLEPFYVSYNSTTQAVTGTAITVQIRDLGGINENVVVNQRPTTLTDAHRYNIGNQGWKSGYALTSTTSITIGTGSKVFTVNLANTVTPIINGDRVIVASAAGITTDFMIGTVTTYSGTTLTVSVGTVGGSGAHTDWIISQYPNDIVTWALASTTSGTVPSNADIWWYFKNASDVFDPATTANNVPIVNTPAPKGHYIVDAFNINRSKVSGIPGLTSVTSNNIRPATGAFFQGRVFYGGVNYTNFNSNIYFSQIIDSTNEAFGNCYQANDLTSETLFDLLPSDGGVISIQNAGTVYKIIALKTALIVFASNGVWAITGNQGVGFTANDYTVAPISDVRTLSNTSFVQVQETIFWWNFEGIFSLSIGAQGIEIKSVTDTTISTFYEGILNGAKQNVRGAYNPVTFIIQWLYRSTEAGGVEDRYTYDRILNYNVITNTFYPWTISESPITINGIFVVDSPGGNLIVNNVVRSADMVVDASTNQVVTFSVGDNIDSLFKYIISKPVGITYSMSFGEEYIDTYTDWTSYNGNGSDYDSYFITGFGVHGQAQKYFQSNYVYVFSDFADDLTMNSYDIQGIWNYSNSASSGYYTDVQSITQTKNLMDVIKRRFKIRGRGLALQLRFSSTAGLPFSLIGWSSFETANASI